jgi:hypothetical protein
VDGGRVAVAKRMPVSTPVGTPSCVGASAIVSAAPAGATSIQQPPNCSTGASRRFSKPSFSM